MFIDRYKKFLKKNGTIHLKTDSDLLYDFTLDEINNNHYELLKDIKNVYKESYLKNSELEKILYIKTFYETMWIELGKTIKYMSFKI